MMSTKTQLQEDNDRLRGRLQEAYDVIGDALGFDDDSEDENGESDASEFEDEE